MRKKVPRGLDDDFEFEETQGEEMQDCEKSWGKVSRDVVKKCSSESERRRRDEMRRRVVSQQQSKLTVDDANPILIIPHIVFRFLPERRCGPTSLLSAYS